MAKQIEGVSEKIEKCAREEFLKNGYTDASLRTIASEAGTTTGSIYSRYGDKEGLFSAIVEPAANEFIEKFRSIQEEFHSMESDRQAESLEDFTMDGMQRMVEYMYEHLEEFRLLVNAAHGTKFQNFVEHLVEIETDYTYKFMESVGLDPTKRKHITKDFMHIMNKALFESFFEVIRHDMSKEEALEYVVMLEKYHNAGWNTESGSKMHEMPSDGTEYEVVDDRVFQSMCDTKTPQGVLSMIRMPHYTEEEVMDNGKTPLLMVLEDLQDPGNVGTIIRTAEGAGVTGIIMSRGTADIFNPKTIRSTMGSIYRMPFLIVDDAVGFVKGLKARKICTYAAHLHGVHSYREEDYTKGTAFLIGNEGNGLTDAMAEAAECLIRIPMEGKVESLNAAIASAVLMYEAHGQRA